MVTKHTPLLLVVVFLIFLLVACGGATEQAPRATQTPIATVSTEPETLIPTQTPFASVLTEPETSIPAEGEGQERDIDDGDVSETDPIITPILSQGTVAILVMDSFAVDPPESEEEATTDENQSGKFCTLFPDGQGGYSGQGVAVKIAHKTKGTVSHGEAVYDEFVRLLGGHGSKVGTLESPSQFVPSWKRATLWNYLGGSVLLIGIDSERYDTTSISQSLEDTFSRLTNYGTTSIQMTDGQTEDFDFPVSGAIVHMSFAFLPCIDKIEDVEEEVKKLKGYLNLLDTAELNKLRDELRRLAGMTLEDFISTEDVESFMASFRETSFYGDYRLIKAYTVLQTEGESSLQFLVPEGGVIIRPHNNLLFDLLSRLSEGEFQIPVINVASAGNSGKRGYPYPFAPAVWDSVVSISAQDEMGVFWSYSNPGEVRRYGGHSDSQNYEDVYGTSFAAPKFSVQAALYLLNGGSIPCQTNTTVVPPLGYSAGAGPWNNLSLAEAAAEYCHSFPR